MPTRKGDRRLLWVYRNIFVCGPVHVNFIFTVNFQDRPFTYMDKHGTSHPHCMMQGCLQYLSASPVAALWVFQDVSEQHRDPLPRDVPTSKCKPGRFMSDWGLSGSASHFCPGLVAMLKDRTETGWISRNWQFEIFLSRAWSLQFENWH